KGSAFTMEKGYYESVAVRLRYKEFDPVGGVDLKRTPWEGKDKSGQNETRQKAGTLAARSEPPFLKGKNGERLTASFRSRCQPAEQIQVTGDDGGPLVTRYVSALLLPYFCHSNAGTSAGSRSAYGDVAF